MPGLMNLFGGGGKEPATQQAEPTPPGVPDWTNPDQPAEGAWEDGVHQGVPVPGDPNATFSPLGPEGEMPAGAPQTPGEIVKEILGDEQLTKDEFKQHAMALTNANAEQQQELLRAATPELQQALSPAAWAPIPMIISTVKAEYGIDITPEQAEQLQQQVGQAQEHWGQ
jgi:plasmid maintenance system antidote protein VapI